MSIDPKDLAQGGVITAFLSVIAGLLGWRLHSKVKHDNAAEARESRFEDNVQRRLEAALGKISELNDELDSVKGRLAEADKRLTIVQMLADGDPGRAVELTQDSAFVDVRRPLRPRQQQRPSPHDPFQAADPYGPKNKG